MESLSPICPWCGLVDDDLWEDVTHGEILNGVECLECERYYTVEVVVGFKTKQERKYKGISWWLRDNVSKGYWFFDKEPDYYPDDEMWMDEEESDGTFFPDGWTDDKAPQVVIDEELNHGELAEVFTDETTEEVSKIFESEWKWEESQ